MANRARKIREGIQEQYPGAIVVERGRGHIKHRHPTNPRTYIIDSVVGETLHYGTNNDLEIDSSWQPGVAPWDFQMINAPYNAYALSLFNAGQIVRYVHPESGEDIAFQPQQLQWTNDIDQIQVIASPRPVAAQIVNEDRLFWQDAYGSGMDFTWETEPVRLKKMLTIRGLADLTPPNATIIAGGNPVFRLRFIFNVTNAIDIYINGVLWNRNQRVATTGQVEFRLGSETLWIFGVPRVYYDGLDGRQEFYFEERFYRTGNNLFVEIRVPWNWIQTAQYPVFIDPTIDSRVGASNNDAWEPSTGNTSTTITSGNPDQTGEWNGSRHTGITISAGSTINTSYLTLYFQSGTTDEPQVTFTGDDTATPAVFTQGTANYDISGRTDTTASVNWDNTNLGAPGSFNTPSLNTIIQELVDSYAPYSSGAIALMHTSTSGDSGRDCQITFYDGDSANAPLLHIVYTESGLTVNLSAAGITASGQIIDQQSGAVTKNLQSGSVVASGQIIDQQSGAVTKNLQSGSIVASGQITDPIPGSMTKTINSAGIAASGQILDPQPGAITKNIQNGSISAAGQIITINAPEPGIQVNLTNALISLSGQIIDPQPGAVSKTLTAGSLVLSGQILDPQPGTVTKTINAAGITISGQIIDPQPGTMTKTINTAGITVAGQILDPIPGAVIKNLSIASILASGQILDIQPGSRSIALGVASLLCQGQTVIISSPVGGTTINLQNASLTVSAQILGIQPGIIAILLGAAVIIIQGKEITISAGAGIITHWRPKPNKTGYDRHLERVGRYYDILSGQRRRK